jgi:serine/threonine protein kinase
LLARYNSVIPPWLESVILHALEIDPERRYQHFSEMAFDLEHPEKVAPHHRRDAPLLERNPLLFFKLLSVALLILNLVLLALLLRK